jgi:hypothetical protein
VIECPHCRTANADKSVICKDCGYSLGRGEVLLSYKQEMKQLYKQRRRAIMQEKWTSIRGKYIEGSMLAINVSAFVYGLEHSSMRYLFFGVEVLAIWGLLLFYFPYFIVMFSGVAQIVYYSSEEKLNSFFGGIKRSGLLMYAFGMWGILLLSTLAGK